MRFHIGLSLNWKTIKKWLIPIAIGIALYLGFNTMTVSADEVKVDTWRLDVNNEQLTLGKFNTYPSGYIYYNLTANTVIDMTELNNYQKIFYFRYTVCSDSDSSSGWSETSWVENVKFEMTNLNCSYTGSSYTGGRVQYITFQGQPPTQAVDPATTSDIYVVWGNLVVSNYYNASSLELINFEVSTTPFVLDPVDQTIINQNQQQIDEQEKTNEKLDDLKENQDKNTEEIKEELKDQFNSCRDSHNLSYISSISPYNYSATLKGDTITMNGTSTSAGNLSIYLNDKTNLILKANTTYTFNIITSGTITGSSYKTIWFKGNNVGVLGSNKTITFQYTPTSDEVASNISFDLSANLTFNNYIIKIMINEGSSSKPYEEYGKEVCENRLDETNDQLGNLNDNITNGNIDSGSGNDFFNNFNTEDNGGISGIITAPLTLINSLLDNQGTCTDLEFPILGKDVAIPSGCILWDKVPNEMETIIQMLVCGTGAYFILRKLFKDIDDLKNPNKQGVSTLDL